MEVAADVPAAALHWAHGSLPNAFAGTSNATLDPDVVSDTLSSCHI